MLKIFTKKLRALPCLFWCLLSCTCAWFAHFSASAAQYAGDCPCDLYPYQYDGGFKGSAELLYFTSSMLDTTYALRVSPNSGGSGGSGSGSNRVKAERVDFDYDPGFQVELGYQFPGTAYEISLRFLSLSLDSSSRVTEPGVYANLSNYFDLKLPPQLDLKNPIYSAKSDIGLDMRVIDLLFGQTVQTANDRVRLKWLVGARSSTIHNKSKVTYSQTAAGDLTEEILTDNDFAGFGPVIGAQALVNLGHGFSVTSEIMTSFLISKIGAHIEDTFTNATVLDEQHKPLVMAGRNSVDHEDNIVSVIDSRIGLLYTLPLRNDSQLGFEAGVQVSHYFDVDFRFSSSGADLGMFGLYLRASYLM